VRLPNRTSFWPARSPAAWSLLALAQAPTTRSWSVAARPLRSFEVVTGPKLEVAHQGVGASGSTSGHLIETAGTEGGSAATWRALAVRMAATFAPSISTTPAAAAHLARIPDNGSSNSASSRSGAREARRRAAQKRPPIAAHPSGRRRTLPAVRIRRAVPPSLALLTTCTQLTIGVRVLESGMESCKRPSTSLPAQSRSRRLHHRFRTRIRHRMIESLHFEADDRLARRVRGSDGRSCSTPRSSTHRLDAADCDVDASRRHGGVPAGADGRVTGHRPRAVVETPLT